MSILQTAVTLRHVFVTSLFLSLSSLSAAPILEETIEHNYAVGPTTRISIHNDDGSIFIYGADIKEIKLQAIKKAYNQERLDQITIDVSVSAGDVVIRTQSPPKPKWGFSDRSGTVDYVIVVPWGCNIERVDLANGEILIDGLRGGVVHASVGNGRLFGHNCFSDLHVEVANGGIAVGFDWWEKQKFSVDAQIVNGNAYAKIPSEAEFHLLAGALNGHVFSDFMERENRQSGGVPKIDMLVGEAPQAEVKLHAVNGSIKVSEANP